VRGLSFQRHKLRRIGYLYSASAMHAIVTAPIKMTAIVNVRSDIPTSLHFRTCEVVRHGAPVNS
jgi:hypothetical protein